MKDEEDCAVVVDKKDCERRGGSLFLCKTNLDGPGTTTANKTRTDTRNLSVYETRRPRNRKNIIPRSPTAWAH